MTATTDREIQTTLARPRQDVFPDGNLGVTSINRYDLFRISE